MSEKLDGLITNHNLDGDASQRALPKKGSWGPDRVPSRLVKNIVRIGVVVGLLVMAAVVFWVGLSFFDTIKGN